MEIDKDTKLAIEAINSGSLAGSIKSSAKYTLTGMLVGSVIGILIGGFIGKSRLIFGLGGAILAGSTGYLISEKK